MPKCELCGEPMPPGEEMFKFHGYSGPCPKPGTPMTDPTPDPRATLELLTRLDAEMTRGEWKAYVSERYLEGSRIFGIESDDKRIFSASDRYWGSTIGTDADREGIAALRNALPAIIRDLRRLVDLEMEAKADAAQIAALEKEVEQLRGEPGVSEERLAELEAAGLDMTDTCEHCPTCGCSVPLQRLRDALAHREGQ